MGILIDQVAAKTLEGPKRKDCEVCKAPLGCLDSSGIESWRDFQSLAEDSNKDVLIFESECDVGGAYNVAKHPTVLLTEVREKRAFQESQRYARKDVLIIGCATTILDSYPAG